ncbi:MAG TPA: helix-turn-helix transcriptional regulator [Chondromyces sp.]|nr:helix-turn-helix transcriptional regulator [Chondromyces sp.]
MGRMGGNMIGYGARLKELRLKHQLTMEEAAKIVGVAKSSYAGYESEFRQPSIEKLILFAEYYQVSVDEILKGTGEQKVSTMNLRDILQKEGLHWEGVPIGQEILKPIIDLLQAIADGNQGK